MTQVYDCYKNLQLNAAVAGSEVLLCMFAMLHTSYCKSTRTTLIGIKPRSRDG